MKSHLLNWSAKLTAAKEAAKALGQVKGDSDLAAIVSEKIKAAGLSSVDRGAVNHWLKGRRYPNVPQFIALCEALNVQPAEVLALSTYQSENVVSFRAREPARANYITDEESEIFDRLRSAPTATRRLALAAALGVLEKSGPTKRPRRKPQR